MKDITVRFVVEISVEDDWSRESYLGDGRKAVVGNRMRSATTQALASTTLPYMERNGITVVGMEVGAAEWIESEATNDEPKGQDTEALVDAVLDEVVGDGGAELPAA